MQKRFKYQVYVELFPPLKEHPAMQLNCFGIPQEDLLICRSLSKRNLQLHPFAKDRKSERVYSTNLIKLI